MYSYAIQQRRRRFRSLLLTAALLVPAPWALAQSSGADPLPSLSAQFLEGYAVEDSQQLLEQLAATLTPSSPATSVFPPTADISPLAMAVLMLENSEGVRDRVRYRITHGVEPIPNPPKASPLPLSFIQIDRFSLGGAIRKQVIDAHGAEHVGPPEAFDAGPHVSWRLITRPVQGRRADILAAGRTEPNDAQAEAITCLSFPCLSLDADLDSAAPWGEMTEIALALETPYPVVRNGLLTPAATIDQLTGNSELFEVDGFRDTPKVPEPSLVAVIEINLGQDTVLSAAMRQGGLLDDSIAAIWKRLVVMPAGDSTAPPMAYAAEAYECRRGVTFPPAGEFCP